MVVENEWIEHLNSNRITVTAALLMLEWQLQISHNVKG